ncbi:hypothetical protein DL897_01250 [Thermoflavimicrobium daqui]|jgi:CRISPR-associated endoribonuclease Cas6|uniref:CRISPR-associated protein Cas6 C-terminal domain-containing protein n=2 Tax=Thermoflavimicrobium daqui TaxID=2137476 RepID=A0A364K8S6_9BACL|nr:hypothetical protein DL897_01250 [Thermoflavimicrobium daqui]
MHRLHLLIKANHKSTGVGILTRRLHAFILESIQQANPQLSQYLHDCKERQSFATYFGNGEIFVHSPDFSVVHSLQRKLLEDSLIDLIHWKGIVQSLHSQHYTKEQIMQQITNKFTLRFLTPTTFYQQGNYYPLPELVRLFCSAAKVLDMCEELAIPRNEIEVWVRKIRIEYASFVTDRVDFGKFNVIGFRGTLTLNLKALPRKEKELLWRLAVYGSMMGFGYKTAWGLGQTRLEPFCYTR